MKRKHYCFILLFLFVFFPFWEKAQSLCMCVDEGIQRYGYHPLLENYYSYIQFQENISNINIMPQTYKNLRMDSFQFDRGFQELRAVGNISSNEQIRGGISGYSSMWFNFTPCNVQEEQLYRLPFWFTQGSRKTRLMVTPNFFSIEFSPNLLRNANTDSGWTIVVKNNGLTFNFSSSDFDLERTGTLLDSVICAPFMEIGNTGCNILFDVAQPIDMLIAENLCRCCHYEQYVRTERLKEYFMNNEDKNKGYIFIANQCPMVIPTGDTLRFEYMAIKDSKIYLEINLTDEQAKNKNIQKCLKKLFCNVQSDAYVGVYPEEPMYGFLMYKYHVYHVVYKSPEKRKLSFSLIHKNSI